MQLWWVAKAALNAAGAVPAVGDGLQQMVHSLSHATDNCVRRALRSASRLFVVPESSARRRLVLFHALFVRSLQRGCSTNYHECVR